MDLRPYLDQAPRGTAAEIARALGVSSVMVSQYAAGLKRVPEDKAPALEAATGHEVTVEESCPRARWVRVPFAGWPKGKPLVYLHEFLRSDDDRALHDHPWSNASILLRGTYVEHTIAAGGIEHRRQLRAGDVRVRASGRFAHRVDLIDGPCMADA